MIRQPTFIDYVTGKPGVREHDTLLRAADRLETYDRLDHALTKRIANQLSDQQIEAVLANISDGADALANLIVEAAYRQRKFEYCTKAAWVRLNDIIACESKKYGSISITDDDAETVAWNFIDEYDRNISENKIFDRVCHTYLNELRNRDRTQTSEIQSGDYVIYRRPGASVCELGRAKRRTLNGHGWFCWYSDGDTAASTPDEYLKPVSDQTNPMADGPFENTFTSPETIGGASAKDWFKKHPQTH